MIPTEQIALRLTPGVATAVFSALAVLGPNPEPVTAQTPMHAPIGRTAVVASEDDPFFVLAAYGIALAAEAILVGIAFRGSRLCLTNRRRNAPGEPG